jgi:chromate transporter
MGIIARSATKLAKKTISKKRLLWTIFVIMALVTAITRKEMVSLFILSGFVAIAAYAPPRWIRRPASSLSLLPWFGLFAP